MPGCLILAAGSHRRFGSHKLLHPMADGRPLIQHTLDAIQASGLPMALIHRPDDQALLDAVATYPLQKIPCFRHAEGQGHSIAAGVQATSGWDGWLICLADMPFIRPDTYLAIADALQTHAIVIPEHQHHFGNPRGFRLQFRDTLAALNGDQGARDLLVHHRDVTRVLPVEDSAILRDIDFPADLNHKATPAMTAAQAATQSSPTTTGNPCTMTDTQNPPADDAAATAETTAPAPTAQQDLPAEENDPTQAVESATAPNVESPVAATEETPTAETETAAETTVETETTAEVETAPEEAAPAEPAAPAVELIRFRDLDLEPSLQQGIADLGFEYATPIQSLSLPHTLQGNDAIGKAQTGTGKTAAFLITIINRLLRTPEQEERFNGEPRALILAPTRELALQIEKDADALIKHTTLTLMSIVGGMDYQKQQRRLQTEILDIIVGTPGRLIDFVRGKDLFLSETEILVIDEADRMLDMGFIPDVKRLVRETPWREYRQTLLFSATFTQDILNLSGNWTRNALQLEVTSTTAAADTVDQKVYIVTTEEKFTLLYNLITQKNLERVMIFANRRDETRDLTHKLRDYGIKCAMLSGDVPQQKRIKTLENFREGKIRVLVATDVAGRGIHIDDITHVVNYTLPEDPEDYVHRIGRTGRAGKSGTSISFACEEDAFQLPAIDKLLGSHLECHQPEPELLAEVPPPTVDPEKQRERDSHNQRRRRPRRPSGNR